MLWFFVLLRVMTNPVSNVFQKLLVRRQASPLFIVGMTHGLLTMICLPALVADPPPASAEFWLNIVLCTVLAVASNSLLVQAVSLADLSILGPINSYKPIVSLLPGVVLLGEVPSVAALFGVALILLGSYGLVDQRPAASDRRGLGSLLRDRGVQYRIGALVLSGTEAVFLKKALLASSPLPTFAVWSACGFLVALLVTPFFRRQSLTYEIGIWRTSRASYLSLALTTGLMQFSTLVILTGLQVSAALALFQTSTLLTVLLGWRVFQEQNIARRLLGATVMVVGAVLIVVSR